MMIKTMNKGYVNLAKYSDFAIHHKQEGFTVIAMKPVVCYATESKRYTSAASVELGCYPSETEAQKVLETIMEHWDAIKEAEYYGAENNFRYISNVFTMPNARGRSRMGKCSVEKAKDEKRYAEKVDFVVKYLLNIANNQELNVFMGKDADEAVLYNETDIRGVIAQMPELVFYEYYYKFKSIYDKSGWDYGSENENEISDESDGDKKVFSGFGCYSEYHINYTAEMLTEIEKLSD